MKKTLTLLLSLLLALGMAGQTLAFSDVMIASDNVDRVVAAGIMQGYPDGTFQPEGQITRAEFAKVAVLTWQEKTGQELPEVAVENKFSDVKADGWYVENIQNAVTLELMKGDAEGTFRPNDTISEAEVITVLVRILGYTDEDLTGAWPENYLIQAKNLGMDFTEADNNQTPAMRLFAAALVCDTLDIPLKDAAVDKEVALRDYGVVTGIAGNRVTIYGCENVQKTYSMAGAEIDVKELAAGQVVNFTANKSGQLLTLNQKDVLTNDKHDAAISREKIELNGKDYSLAKDAVVLLINSSGGVNVVENEDLLAGTFVADLRTSKVTAPIQYVLEGNQVGLLLIGDYTGSHDLHFGFIESAGEGVDGTVVTFWGDGRDYIWQGDEEPEEDALYSYTFSSDGVEAYKVGVDDEQIKNGVVDKVADICLTTDGKQFIVTKDTVIMEVEYNADKSIKSLEYVDAVAADDIIRVRYVVENSNKTGLEAAYIIIDATDR